MSASLSHRATVLRRTRAFLDSRGFTEVETPVLVPSPGLDVHLDAFEANAAAGAHGKFLITSPEYQMKRLLAAGSERIYQIVRCFRRGESGERHNPEFTMLELYRARAGMNDIIRDTEQLVAALSGGAFHVHGARMAALPPFRRMRVDEAFRAYAGIEQTEMLRLAEHDEETFYRTLAFDVEPKLALLPEAVFLTHYPKVQASLARTDPEDSRFAERFELYVAGVELCNGFGELTDAVEQRARFEHDQAQRRVRNLPVYPIDEKFLAALPDMPPSGGNAIGLDRLVALLAGTTNIAAAIAFPDAAL